MTRNEGELLKKCVDSIFSTVTVDKEIFVVDNASTNVLHLKILNEIESYEGVNVIRNSRNNWVLGVNSTIEYVKKEVNSKYFFLTDGDIDFTICKVEPCWLSYLVKKMNENVAIGKLGLSLSWHYLEAKGMRDILEQEKRLYSDRMLGELYVSGVDTTATLFRHDWSIDGTSRIYPGHMQYIKPELYSCRTPRNILVEHLGWELYEHGKINKQELNEKVRCFTFVSGAVKREQLIQVSKKYQIMYKALHLPIARFWKIRRTYYLFKYFFKHLKKSFVSHGSGL